MRARVVYVASRLRTPASRRPTSLVTVGFGAALALAVSACQPPAGSSSGSGGSAGSKATEGGRGGGGAAQAGSTGQSGSTSIDPPPTAGSGGSSGANAGSGGAGPGASGGAGGANEPAPASDAGPPPGDDPPAADAGPGGDAGEPGDPSSAMLSPACASATMAPQQGLHTLQAAGLQRRFLVRLPAGYDPKKPWPIIFAFHGAGNQNATTFENRIGLRQAVGNEVVLVYGESLYRPGSTTARSWQDEGQLPANLAYIDAVMAWLSERVCFAKNRVFAAGQSSGAYFAQTVGCHRGDVFRAVASSDGGERYFRDCKGNPGAFIRYRPTGANAADSRRARDFILERNQCSRTTEKTTISQCISYTGCQNGARVWECTDGGSHDWPAYMDRGVWTFFSGL